MDTREALDLLGLDDGADVVLVRAAYRRLVRRHHPDVAGPGDQAHRTTSALGEAHDVLLHALASSETGTVARDPSPSDSDLPAHPASDVAASPATATAPPPFWPTEPVDAAATDADTIAVDAPSDEAFAALYEAAGLVGDVSYVDRQLAILEIIVRFEGGPSCSVVMTVQGRATHTDVLCTMDSIEAAPAPPIAPVIEALVDALRGDLVVDRR